MIDNKLKEDIEYSFLHGSLPQAHTSYLYQLKQNGFEPRVIYVIGACVLDWTKTAKMIWPAADYVVFDAFEPVEFLYQNQQLSYHMGVLSDQDGREVKFYQHDYKRTGNSYYQEIGNSKEIYQNYILKRTRTLDTVVAEKGFPLPDLIKIDVQGSEIDILRGASRVLSHAKHMIVELQHTEYNEGAPKADESLPIIEEMGWKCVAPLFQNNGPDGDYGFEKI